MAGNKTSEQLYPGFMHVWGGEEEGDSFPSGTLLPTALATQPIPILLFQLSARYVYNKLW